MSSSLGVIPRDKLNIWEIFRDVGPEGEEILKTAKLAHVAYRKEAFVVTTADETYSFLGTLGVPSVRKITKIPQLCGVRVKEFVVAMIELAITEDGSLYSWIINDPDVLKFETNSTHFATLGRLEADDGDKANYDLAVEPHLVLGGSLTGKKVCQVALSSNRVMALTVGGEVHQWGGTSNWRPTLVPKRHFYHQEVIAIACTDDIFVALTSNGELFQWELDNKTPQNVVLDTAPFKKIMAGIGFILALTDDGALYARFPASVPKKTKPDWTAAFEGQVFEDIAAKGTDHVVVFELKNKIRFAFCYSEENCHPPITSFSQRCSSIDEFFAENNHTTYRTVCAKNLLKLRTVGDDIANLWGRKENSDVTFALEGKSIAAHKVVLTSRSDYFAKMFNNEWNETRAGSCIEIKDTMFDIFEALLFYIYHDTVKFGEHEYENVFGLMMLADAHCAVKIREECEHILMRNITAENAVFLVQNAASANASDLERAAVRFILDNRLIDVNSSPQELGMEAFQKLSVAAFRRM